MSSLLNALGYVGDSLDKLGGRAVRGALAGKPRELASVVPFSDRFGITDPGDITSGRDLTDKYGLTQKTDKGWGAWGAGLGAEMLLDPTNLFPGRAVARGAAQGAKRLGRGTSLATDLIRPSSRLAQAVDPSLLLKYDRPGLITPESVGLARHDPEWINNRTVYHGTGTPGLTTGTLDPLKTKGNNLYGHGIYTTDSRKIAGEYADVASERIASDLPRDVIDPYRDELYRRWVAEHGAHNVGQPTRDDVLEAFPHLKPKPFVYQGQSNFDKILDLDLPPDQRVRSMVHDLAGRSDRPYQRQELARIDREGAPTGDYVQLARDTGAKGLVEALKGEGYDALTHTGGTRVGRGKLLHQVTIGLEPKYRQWAPTDPTDVDPMMAFPPGGGKWDEALAGSADSYGPRYPTTEHDLGDLLRGSRQYRNADNTHGHKLIDDLLGSPFAPLIAREVHPGSRVLGNGTEALAIGNDLGGVLRVGPSYSPWAQKAGLPPIGRPKLPEVLQPVRANQFGNYLVEHLPRVTPIHSGRDESTIFDKLAAAVAQHVAATGDTALEGRLNRAMLANQSLRRFAAQAGGSIEESILDRRAGLRPWDIGRDRWHNASLTAEGQALTHDAGAIWPSAGMSRSDMIHAFPLPGPALPQTGRQITKLERLGAPQQVREGIERGIAQGTRGQGVPLRAATADDVRLFHENRGVMDDFVREMAGRFPEALTDSSRSPVRSPLAAPTPSVAALIDALNVGTTVDHVAPLFGGAGRAGKAAARGVGLDPRFKGLRNTFPMVKPGGRVVGASPYRDEQVVDAAERLIANLDRKMPGARTMGLYSPGTNIAANTTRNPAITRHEIGHGMVRNAVLQGPRAVAGLPPAWQPGAWLKLLDERAGVGGSLGRYLDEVGQRVTQNRGLGGQVRSAYQFLASPAVAGAYAGLSKDPLVANLIRAVPYSGTIGGGSADLVRVLDALRTRDDGTPAP